MLIKQEEMLLPVDINPTLITFLKTIIDTRNRYIIGIQILDTKSHAEGYVTINTYRSTVEVAGVAHSRSYPIYLNAWEHVMYVVPANDRLKLNSWISPLLDVESITWSYYKQKVKKCIENSQQI